MATTYKVLGQSAPTATTATTLYTVPSVTQTIISTLTVCNRGSASATFRVAVRPNGDILANQHYVVYDGLIDGNDTKALTLGITIDSADVVTVYASSANLSFGLFGSEIA
jgi:hypothetical protein